MDVGEESAIFVGGRFGAVVLEPDRFALEQILGELADFATVELDLLCRMHGLGRIDFDQPKPSVSSRNLQITHAVSAFALICLIALTTSSALSGQMPITP